jgi:hypothetical protein
VINIKPIDTIAAKFVKRASAAGGDYKDGVMNPRRPQMESAIAAADSWAAGVQQAVTDKRFAKGLQRAGNAKWQDRASNVGAQRYPQGVQAAQGSYTADFGPYLQVLSNLNLPARFPRGDPRNNDRVAAVTVALHQKKVAG